MVNLLFAFYLREYAGLRVQRAEDASIYCRVVRLQADIPESNLSIRIYTHILTETLTPDANTDIFVLLYDSAEKQIRAASWYGAIPADKHANRLIEKCFVELLARHPEFKKES